MKAVFKREFKSYFTSPIGAAILSIFFFLSGTFFYVYFNSGVADLSGIFSTLFVVVMIIIPLLTMRSFSEDKRQKTDQLLFTSPVSITSVVIGKFLAAFAVYSIMMSIMVVYQIIVTFYVSPDWMVFIGNLLGIILFGACLISVGLLISTLVESQIVAALVTYVIEAFLLLFDLIIQALASVFGLVVDETTGVFDKLIAWFSFYDRYSTFTKGTLDYSNIVFFVTLTALFLFLTVRFIARKRYV